MCWWKWVRTSPLFSRTSFKTLSPICLSWLKDIRAPRHFFQAKICGLLATDPHVLFQSKLLMHDWAVSVALNVSQKTLMRSAKANFSHLDKCYGAMNRKEPDCIADCILKSFLQSRPILDPIRSSDLQYLLECKCVNENSVSTIAWTRWICVTVKQGSTQAPSQWAKPSQWSHPRFSRRAWRWPS